MNDQQLSIGHAFDDDEIALAESNYEAQEWLARELHRAWQLSTLSIAQVAAALELSEDETSDRLAGDVDLTLSELRQLATAIDAHVTYRVDPVINTARQWVENFDKHEWLATDWSRPAGIRP